MNKQYVLLIGLIAILIAGSLIASPDYTNSDSMNDSSAADNGTASVSNNGFENLLSIFGSNSSSSDNSSNNVEEVDLKLASKSSFLYKSGRNVKISSGLENRGALALIKYQYDDEHYKTFEAYSENGLWYIPVKNFTTSGKHKIIVSCEGKKLEKTITIKKRKVTIKAKSKKVKYHKNRYLKIKIKDKYNKKPLKNKKVIVKVSGHTYKLKTDKKGIAKFNTRKLSSGKHKVKIIVKTPNYKKATKKVYVTVKKPKPKKKKTASYSYSSSYSSRSSSSSGYGSSSSYSSGSSYPSNDYSGGGYIGSRNSDKFHYSWCGQAGRIKSSNLVHFSSRSDALSRGYSPCSFCNP